MSRKTCLSCSKLRKCKTATAEMVVENGFCALWEGAEAGSVHARQRIIQEFGSSAVLHIPNPPRKVESKMAVARRTLLRKLAIESEMLEANPQSFALNQKDLIELLEEEFPGIGDMSDEEVEALYSEATGGSSGKEDPEEEKPKGRGRGRAKKKEEEEPTEEKPKGRGRGRAKKKKEEPDEKEEKPKSSSRGRGRGRGGAKKAEPEEVPVEEKPKSSRGRGRGAASKRSSAPKKEEKDSVDDSDGPGLDLGPLLDRLDDIGPMAAKAKAAGEKNSKSLTEMRKVINGIKETVDGIADFLTWQYNESLYDEDGDLYDEDITPIDTILGADWS